MSKEYISLEDIAKTLQARNEYARGVGIMSAEMLAEVALGYRYMWGLFLG